MSVYHTAHAAYVRKKKKTKKKLVAGQFWSKRQRVTRTGTGIGLQASESQSLIKVPKTDTAGTGMWHRSGYLEELSYGSLSQSHSHSTG